MLISLAIIFLGGLLSGAVSRRLKLPGLLGMLLVGIIFGPHNLNLLDQSILMISPELRKIALIIILIKAGLSLDIQDLKKVGRPAILLCFVPATFEIIGFLLFAPALLHISLLEAGIIGAVMGAVSPAVIIPKMTKMIDEGWGTDQGIPQMIIAGSSADDVYVIVLFTAFVSLAGGENASVMNFFQIPVSIILGVLLGLLGGFLLSGLFKRFHMRDSIKVIIILSVSFIFAAAEDLLSGTIPVSGLLAVMSMGITVYSRYQALAKRISRKFTKLWIAAELILFVLVGAAVNIEYALQAGFAVLVMLLIGMAFRLCGTCLCVVKTPLNGKERLFCLFAEIPKATVQAAIGGVPLAKGLACGNIVLTTAVTAILIFAPLGAFLIDFGQKRLLNRS